MSESESEEASQESQDYKDEAPDANDPESEEEPEPTFVKPQVKEPPKAAAPNKPPEKNNQDKNLVK